MFLFICIAFASLKYLWHLWKYILNGCAHIFSPTGSCHGPWNSRGVSLMWPLLASQSSTRRLAMDYGMFLYFTCRRFVCQHLVMAEATVKQRAFAFIVFDFQNGIPGYVHKGIWHHKPCAGIPPDCDYGGEVGTVAFKTASRPLSVAEA